MPTNPELPKTTSIIEEMPKSTFGAGNSSTILCSGVFNVAIGSSSIVGVQTDTSSLAFGDPYVNVGYVLLGRNDLLEGLKESITFSVEYYPVGQEPLFRVYARWYSSFVTLRRYYRITNSERHRVLKEIALKRTP
jgi:hypothetical protein